MRARPVLTRVLKYQLQRATDIRTQLSSNHPIPISERTHPPITIMLSASQVLSQIEKIRNSGMGGDKSLSLTPVDLLLPDLVQKGPIPGAQTPITPDEPDVLGDGDGVGGALGEVVWRRVYRGFRNCRFLG